MIWSEDARQLLESSASDMQKGLMDYMQAAISGVASSLASACSVVLVSHQLPNPMPLIQIASLIVSYRFRFP